MFSSSSSSFLFFSLFIYNASLLMLKKERGLDSESFDVGVNGFYGTTGEIEIDREHDASVYILGLGVFLGGSVIFFATKIDKM